MYERLIKEYEDEVKFVEIKLPEDIKGLYSNGVIAINNKLTNREKTCVVTEEIGHYKTTTGDILDQKEILNRKKEKLARRWGYDKLIKIEDIIGAYKSGVRNRYELAEHLEVCEDFIEDCLAYFKEKYGLYYAYDKYIVYFEPLGVLEKF